MDLIYCLIILSLFNFKQYKTSKCNIDTNEYSFENNNNKEVLASLKCNKFEYLEEELKKNKTEIEKSYKIIYLDFGLLSNKLLYLDFNYSALLIEKLKYMTVIIKNVSKIIIKADSYKYKTDLIFKRVIFYDTNFEFYCIKNDTFNSFSILDCNDEFNLDFTLNVDHLHFNKIYPDCILPKLIRTSLIKNIYFHNLNFKIYPYYRNNQIEQKFYLVIDKLFFINSQIILNTDIINFNWFTDISSLSIFNSNLNEIEENLFTNLKKLKLMNLSLVNFEEFIHSSENKWLSELNSNINFDLNDCHFITRKLKYYFTSAKFVLVLNDLNKKYEYLEEDFCLFKHFPHSKLVFPVIFTKNNLTCTCTLIWLIQNWKLMGLDHNSVLIKTSSVLNCFDNIEEKIENCNFNQKLKSCGLKNVNNSFQLKCDLNKTYHSQDCIMKYTETIIVLIIGIMSFMTKILSIIGLFGSNYKQNLYKYLIVENLFEAFTIFILVFSSIIDYGFYRNDNIEANISQREECLIDFRFKSISLVNFKLKYLNAIKYISITCCVISNFFLSLDRYLSISSNKKFKWFYKRKNFYKKIFFFSIFTSILLNIDKIIENDNTDLATNTLFLVQDILFILILISSLIVNLLLVNYMRKVFHNKKKISNKNKTENAHLKLLLMVIIECLLMILSRIPEIISSYFRIKLFFLPDLFGAYNIYLRQLDNYEINFFLLINFSFFIKFFNYLIFNRKFKHSIKNLFHLKNNNL